MLFFRNLSGISSLFGEQMEFWQIVQIHSCFSCDDSRLLFVIDVLKIFQPKPTVTYEDLRDFHYAYFENCSHSASVSLSAATCACRARTCILLIIAMRSLISLINSWHSTLFFWCAWTRCSQCNVYDFKQCKEGLLTWTALKLNTNSEAIGPSKATWGVKFPTISTILATPKAWFTRPYETPLELRGVRAAWDIPDIGGHVMCMKSSYRDPGL